MRPDIELTKKYGLDDEQFDAMCGMCHMLPRPVIWRFRKHTPKEIRDLVEICADKFIKDTRSLVRALNERWKNPELLDVINDYMARIMKNAEHKDSIIEKKLREESLHATQNSTSQSELPDNSI